MADADDFEFVSIPLRVTSPGGSRKSFEMYEGETIAGLTARVNLPRDLLFFGQRLLPQYNVFDLCRMSERWKREDENEQLYADSPTAKAETGTPPKRRRLLTKSLPPTPRSVSSDGSAASYSQGLRSPVQNGLATARSSSRIALGGEAPPTSVEAPHVRG